MTLLATRPSATELWVVSGACGYAVVLAVATRVTSYDYWGALVVAPVLIAVTLPLLRRVAARDTVHNLYPLLVTALLLKLAMALPRWAMAFVLYEHGGDAARYDEAARQVLPAYRQLVFGQAPIAGGDGTKMVGSITAGIYTVIGPSLLGAFVVFSWLGFLGLLGCYRAARLAMPELDHRRYAVLLFFLPSMAFWPSSIGKEALLTLAIGTAAYGAARLFTGSWPGAAWLLAGIYLAFLIRPHIAAMLATAVALALLVRRPRRATAFTPVVRVVVATLVAVLGFFVVAKAAESLGIEDVQSATEELTFRSDQTAQGGSQFEATPITSPVDVPMAILTVLFRPFPWESTNAQMLVAGLESNLLLLLTALSYRRWGTALRHWRAPYVVLAAVYLVAFIYAFSTFGNFGIIARQRVQVLPFLLLFLCLIPRPSRTLLAPDRASHPMRSLP